jgi:hypothetical protein
MNSSLSGTVSPTADGEQQIPSEGFFCRQMAARMGATMQFSFGDVRGSLHGGQ